MNSKDQAVTIAIGKILTTAALTAALALTMVFTVAKADSHDHVVVTVEALTLEQVVERELQSTKFAKQIAAYNGLKDTTALLPAGTSLKIPKPYLLDRDFGRIAFVKGDVIHVQKSLVVNPPTKGAMVFAGDVLTTGEDGFLSLSFNSGASVNLQPSSRVTVVDVDCFDPSIKCVIGINADRGVVSSEVNQRPEGEPPVKFGIETPFLSAAVRGTAFYVDVNDQSSRMGVTRGLVAATAENTSEELPKGKGLLAQAGITPTVVDLLPAPELSMASSESVIISEEDRISWKPINGANDYQVTIATDELLAEPVSVQLVTQNNNQPMLSAAGKYYASVAGVDAKQFVGLPSKVEFNYATIDDTSQLELQVQRMGSIVEVSVPDYNDPVELIISNSIDADSVNRRIVGDLSQMMSLTLDPKQDWVFKARKVLSDTSVSMYSNQYLLEATD